MIPRPRRRCPNCGPEKRVGHARPGKKLMIPPVRFSTKQQPRLGRPTRMSQHRGLLTPEERARIMQLQDLLIDRFVEQREATAAGRCRRDLCWNLIGAVSGWMRIRGQAARSIG